MWFWIVVLLAHAAPEGDGLIQHRAAADRAAKAELERDWPGVLTSCQSAIDLLPTGPRAARCARRIAWFEARRDTDGGFDGWTRLDTVRRDLWKRDPALARTEVAVVRDAPDATPLLRAEAGLWLAHDAMSRLGDPALALQDTTPIYEARAALDDEHRRDVTLTHALMLAKSGRAAEAAVVEAAATVPGNPRATPVEEALVEAHRGDLRRASWAAVALFAAASALGAWRATSSPRPWALLPMGVGLLGAYAIADSWDPGTGDAVLWMTPPLALIHVIAARAQRGLAGPIGRVAVGALAAIASVACAWLAFDHTGTLNQVWW